MASGWWDGENTYVYGRITAGEDLEYNAIRYSFIAKCQYSCTWNVLWCQVHSPHIPASRVDRTTTAGESIEYRGIFQQKVTNLVYGIQSICLLE